MKHLEKRNIETKKKERKIETLEKKCEIGSKLAIKILERRHCSHSGVFIVNVVPISRLFLAFLLSTLSK